VNDLVARARRRHKRHCSYRRLAGRVGPGRVLPSCNCVPHSSLRKVVLCANGDLSVPRALRLRIVVSRSEQNRWRKSAGTVCFNTVERSRPRKRRRAGANDIFESRIRITATIRRRFANDAKPRVPRRTISGTLSPGRNSCDIQQRPLLCDSTGIRCVPKV
jgi:hypothetical protein